MRSNSEDNGLVKLSGKICEYRCAAGNASFVLSANDRQKLGLIAVAAAAVGLSGQAAAITTSASDVEEAADYVQFLLDAQRVEGWVWRSPFRDGDVVEIAAAWQGDRYEAYAIARPEDKTIALYPHCSRSMRPHIECTLKWWAVCNAFVFVALLGGGRLFVGPGLLQGPFAFGILGFIALSLAAMFFSLSRQYMPFARTAEAIFHVLGLPNASNLDLVKSTKAQRTESDPAELGVFYFRY
jgi:hypothetical protein